LAYQAGSLGGVAPAVLNAANEVAVAAFLSGDLSFMGIPAVIKKVLKQHRPILRPSLTAILQADQWARKAAEEAIKCIC
jgi:1-deoxy-D-xylulose-5-phosphate reductoisomerase